MVLPLRDVLIERRETVRATDFLGDWQAITIKFSGQVLPRARDSAFKGAMFAAYSGDLVFSKIDARNGAVGLIPADIPKAVVTTEYPVFIPRTERLRPEYLRHLLRAEHFKEDLRRRASGTSGRKRVTPEGFLSLEIPVPSLHEQDRLIATYADALEQAARLEQEADALEQGAWQAFELALGVSPPPPLPDRPVFVARFKDVERWSQESILRAIESAEYKSPAFTLPRLGEVIADLENGWSPKCHDHSAQSGRWGVLKLGAVSFGVYDEKENKQLPETMQPRPEYEVRAGDVLISRANVVRYVGACAYVDSTRDKLMLCDKIFRVRFQPNGRVEPQFLAEVMKLRFVREQIESRLTGTSPTMKNISKPALLGLRIPVPDDVTIQQSLVNQLVNARSDANLKHSEASTLRHSAWAAFESALFTPTGAAP